MILGRGCWKERFILYDFLLYNIQYRYIFLEDLKKIVKYVGCNLVGRKINDILEKKKEEQEEVNRSKKNVQNYKMVLYYL